ncbi:uncharacterized protein PG998_008202 [Apiospora kogelbergensis]|uniref:uncharacterized protein n=1 Tax=Apiospora kogelbergensis TaxID=1337665 RepID=UPI00312FF5B1
MASTSGSVFSETLKEITNTKLQELSKRRAAFEAKKSTILSSLDGHDKIKRLITLSDGVKSCYAIKLDSSGNVAEPVSTRTSLEVELKNLDSFIAQARYDPSVSVKTLEKWEASLLGHLDTMSLKYAYASLYAQLVTESLAPEAPSGPTEVEEGGDEEMTEPFETIESARKLEAKQQWEQDVFVPAQVDEANLGRFLKELFVDEPTDSSKKAKARNILAKSIQDFEAKLAEPNQFSAYTLKWVIEGLLASDRLSNEKREALRDFIKNDIILGEIADVLNMRISALDSWSWGDNVPLEQRRKISGVYNVHMEEELLQSIFLQYIGVKWSVFFKRAFKSFRKMGGPWLDVRQPIPELEKLRREYYLRNDIVSGWQTDSVQHVRRSTHRKDYFMARLLDKESQQVEILDGQEEVLIPTSPQFEMAGYSACSPMALSVPQCVPQPRKRKMRSVRAAARSPSFRPGPEHSETESDRESDSAKKNPMQVKQRLLQILSTEASSPHTTIHAILSFFGVSETWLQFFNKFLEVPLKFADDPADTPIRTRRRGTPTSHILSDVFGEVVFFCLDFATNQSTGGSLLYRLYDDAWFWSASHDAATKAWATMQRFAAVTGTRLDTAKTGCIRISGNPDVTPAIHSDLPKGDIQWGFLRLSPQTGRFEINQALVDSHVEELQRQLKSKQKTVFSFIQAWNSYANTFFTSNFGEAANCFGRSHVDAMLETHSRIQREVFRTGAVPGTEGSELGANSVVEYLKALLHRRYGVEDIPDAFMFFPVELGGLDLRSPFIPILQIRNSILADPFSLLDEFKQAEIEAYHKAKQHFEESDHSQNHWVPNGPGEADNFFSLEEFGRFREEIWCEYDKELVDVYRKLLERPDDRGGIETDVGVASGLSALAGSHHADTLRGIKSEWHSMEPYWRWVVTLYGPEVIARFGGLRLVDPGLLPMGMVSLFREKRMSWQD